MTYLGVFATPEEIEDMKQPVPYMVFGTVKDANEPGGYSPVTQRSPQEKCHAYALAHGLPEFSGFYGCDLTTGEFVKP